MLSQDELFPSDVQLGQGRKEQIGSQKVCVNISPWLPHKTLKGQQRRTDEWPLFATLRTHYRAKGEGLAAGKT